MTPSMQKNKIKELFNKVKLLVLDVDGVLTKGEIIYDEDGREVKIFNVKDGLGIFLLSKVGIKTIFLTAKDSPIVHQRAKDCAVEEVIGGILPKEKVLSEITKKYKVKEEEICFVGDDVIDLEFMRRIGLAVAVEDAHPDVKREAGYITTRKGGEGAVREVVDLILEAKGLREAVYKFIGEA